MAFSRHGNAEPSTRTARGLDGRRLGPMLRRPPAALDLDQHEGIPVFSDQVDLPCGHANPLAEEAPTGAPQATRHPAFSPASEPLAIQGTPAARSQDPRQDPGLRSPRRHSLPQPGEARHGRLPGRVQRAQACCRSPSCGVGFAGRQGFAWGVPRYGAPKRLGRPNRRGAPFPAKLSCLSRLLFSGPPAGPRWIPVARAGGPHRRPAR